MTGPRPIPIDGPRIRRAPIPPDAQFVVRGDPGDPTVTRDQAEQFLRRYPGWGRYGVSAYFIRVDADIDDLAATQLARFVRLDLYRIRDLETAGFAVVPTFRTPHVTIAFMGDLDAWLRDLANAKFETRPNPYHEDDAARPTRRRRTR